MSWLFHWQTMLLGHFSIWKQKKGTNWFVCLFAFLGLWRTNNTPQLQSYLIHFQQRNADSLLHVQVTIDHIMLTDQMASWHSGCNSCKVCITNFSGLIHTVFQAPTQTFQLNPLISIKAVNDINKWHESVTITSNVRSKGINRRICAGS